MKITKRLKMSIILVTVSLTLLIFSFAIPRWVVISMWRNNWTLTINGPADGNDYLQDFAVHPENKSIYILYSKSLGDRAHLFIAKYLEDAVTTEPRLIWEQDINERLLDFGFPADVRGRGIGNIVINNQDSYLYAAVKDFDFLTTYPTYLLQINSSNGVIESYGLYTLQEDRELQFAMAIGPQDELYITGYHEVDTYPTDIRVFCTRYTPPFEPNEEPDWHVVYDDEISGVPLGTGHITEAGTNIIYGSDGYLYLTGQVMIPRDLSNEPRLMVTKVNPDDGDVIRSTHYVESSVGRDIVQDEDGNLFIIGSTHMHINGYTSLADVLILKYDKDSGELLPVETYSGSGNWVDEGKGITYIVNRGVFWTGSVYSGARTGSDIIVKGSRSDYLDIVDWTAHSDDIGLFIEADSEDFIYVAGTVYTRRPRLKKGLKSFSTDQDVWIRKYTTPLAGRYETFFRQDPRLYREVCPYTREDIRVEQKIHRDKIQKLH